MGKSAALDGTFAALADPTRRAILERLAIGEATVGELAAPHRVSLSAVSKHLTVLEGAGLVRRERRGRRQYCRLDARPLVRAGDWVTHHARLWNAQLAMLEAYLRDTKGA